MTGIVDKKITQELDHLKKDLTQFKADNKVKEFIGRSVQKLEAGFQKLAHFFETLKWESKQQRDLYKLDRQFRILEEEFRNVSEDYKNLSQKDKDVIEDLYTNFNEEIHDHLETMKNIVALVKRKGEKVDLEQLEIVENDIATLIIESEKEIKSAKGEVEYEGLSRLFKEDETSKAEAEPVEEEIEEKLIPRGMKTRLTDASAKRDEKKEFDRLSKLLAEEETSKAEPVEFGEFVGAKSPQEIEKEKKEILNHFKTIAKNMKTFLKPSKTETVKQQQVEDFMEFLKGENGDDEIWKETDLATVINHGKTLIQAIYNSSDKNTPTKIINDLDRRLHEIDSF